MSKVRLKNPTGRKWGSAANVPGAYYGKGRSIPARIAIRRIWGYGRHKKYAFQACVVLNTRARLGGRRPPGATVNCAEGKNPRVALAGAFRKMATSVKSRGGSFSGFAGYSRTNRKSRRVARRSKRSR